MGLDRPTLPDIAPRSVEINGSPDSPERVAGAFCRSVLSCYPPIYTKGDNELRCTATRVPGIAKTRSAGTPADSEDTLRFAELTGVRPMIETYPLTKAAEGYARMMSGQRRGGLADHPCPRMSGPSIALVDGRLAYQRGTFSTSVTPRSGGASPTTDGKFLRIYRQLADGSWNMIIDSFSSDRP